MIQEFHLSVTPLGDDEYLVRTEQVAPGVPLAEEQVAWPIDTWLQQSRQLMQDPLLKVLQDKKQLGRGTGEPTVANLVSFGQTLYNQLFQGTIRDSWVTAQGIAYHRRERLRLRLGLKGTRLTRIPWEVLQGDRPLATGTDVMFSRYQPTPIALPSPLLPHLHPDLQQPLRVLVVLAAPEDQERLALRHEVETLQAELRRVATSSEMGPLPELDLTILEQPGREALTQALEQGDYQVLHYSGHSNVSATGGELYLVSGQTGLTETLSGEDLAGLLVNNGICMVVLNSCRGAHAASEAITDDTATQSLAESLVRRGIPGVLAMAERIPDSVALTLSRLFYRNLKQGYPVDLSLNRARQGLISAYGSHQLYWALPILYLHQNFDGFLTVPAPAAADREANLDPPEPIVLEPVTNATASEATVPPPSVSSVQSQRVPPDMASAASLLAIDDTDTPISPEELSKAAELIRQLSGGEADTDLEEPLLAAGHESLLPDTATDLPAFTLEHPLREGDHPDDLVGPLAYPGTEAEPEAGLLNQQQLAHVVAAYRREVALNPKDANAYHKLGLALYKLGEYEEAAQMYRQAIELDPSRSDLYRNLGTALYRQGNIPAALDAYSQALEKLSHPAPATALSSRSPANPIPNPLAAFTGAATGTPTPTSLGKRLPLWSVLTVLGTVGAIGVALTGLGVIPGGFWSAPVARIESSPSPAAPLSPSRFPTDPQEWASQSTEAVTAIAIDRLSHADLDTGQQAVTALLDRSALAEARAALATVPNRNLSDPRVTFLWGRLIWQSLQTGDPQNYTIDDARRYWETAVRDQPNVPAFRNALGFAYLAEGNLERANREWLRSLSLSEQILAQNPPAQNQPLPADMLTAYAGMAIALHQSANQQPPAVQANLRKRADELYRLVTAQAPDAFQLDSLQKNWLWTEASIREWQSLGQTVAQRQ
nr:CHAT domain-containing protein [Trichothermofontia sichuanensis]